MQIPHDQLSPEALRGLIEEFVTRDGTDLTDAARNIEKILAALEQGRAVIDFDEEEGTTQILPVEPPRGRAKWLD